MLAKINRIRLDKEFDRVFKTGQSFYGKVFGIKVADNGLQTSRFGIMISLKVSKKAVIRNKLRRQIRAIISKNISNMHQGKDVVIIVFPPILEKSYDELETGLTNAFKKLGILPNIK